MSKFDSMISAEAWQRLVSELEELGPNPPQPDVVRVLCQVLWDVEGMSLHD